jgi:thiamine pyrophosphate-dependent acetolactate synthase large subunit-like protein
MTRRRRFAILHEARWAASALRQYVSAHTTRHPGADFMVDVFRSLGFEYLFANPSSSFGSIHESVLRQGNRAPEFITCAHEELAAAMADGYYKISGTPGLVCVHGTVGLQHAAMAIYNSYCDQIPVYMVLGNTADAAKRRGRVEWVHSAHDPSALVRDFVKWADHPVSLTHFAESAARAYEIAMTPPRLPVALVVDSVLQQTAQPSEPGMRVPRVSVPKPPHADPAGIRDIARALVRADNPVLVAGRAARSAVGLRLMVELAETVQAAVIDEGWRLNFPTRHSLNQSFNRAAALSTADVVLGLEPDDFFTAVHRLRGQVNVLAQPLTPDGAKLIRLGVWPLTPRANYQTGQRRLELDLDVAGDAEASLPALIDAVREEMNPERQRAADSRADQWADSSAQAHARLDAVQHAQWDARPVSTARLSAEIWRQIQHEDWSLVSFTRRVSDWPRRLWDCTAHHHFIGGPGGDGVGYTAPAAAGAALANRRHGRLSVCIQPDGDLLSSSSVLWTLAHHRIPLLTVMHNNRAYHEERLKLRKLSKRYSGDADPSRLAIGTALDDPNIDFAGLARSMGVEAEGPILDPEHLAAALARGVAAVKEGRPYLIDVVTQPR